MKPSGLAKFCVLLGAAAMLFAADVAFAAAPSTTDPEAFLEFQQIGDLAAWHADAIGHLAAGTKILDQLERLRMPAKWDNVYAMVNSARHELRMATRSAARLRPWGQAAGMDVQIRSDTGYRWLETFAVEFKSLPENKQKALEQYRKLDGEMQKLADNDLAAVESLEKSGDWEQADAAMFALHEPVELYHLWDFGRGPGPLDFIAKWSKVNEKLEKQRREIAATALAALARDATPDFAAVAAQAAAAVESVRTRGQAIVDQKPYSPPEAMVALAGLWHGVHVQAVRARGLYWARLASDERSLGDLNRLDGRGSQLYIAMSQSLPGLIEADRTRATGAGAEERYAEWVAACAITLSLIPDGALREKLAASLASFGRSPDVMLPLMQYQRATDKLLYWRHEAVNSYIHYHLVDSRFSAKRLRSGVGNISDLSFGGNCFRLGSAVLPEVLRVEIPSLVREYVGSPAMVTRSFEETDPRDRSNLLLAIRSTESERIEISPGLDARSAAAELIAELAPSGSHPLTLDAAEALVAASHNRFDTFVGKFSGFEIMPMAASIAAVDENAVFDRYGLRFGGSSIDPPRQLAIRFTLEPTWGAHRYFFVVAH